MVNMINSPSKLSQRVLVEQESGESILISTTAWLSLAKRAGKNEIPLGIVEQVYVRGLLDAELESKNSPEQQAFQRVDSFIHKGKAYEMDADLLDEVTMPDPKRHMHVVKKAIKRYQNKKPINENLGAYALGAAIGGAAGKLTGKAINRVAGGTKKRREIDARKRWYMKQADDEDTDRKARRELGLPDNPKIDKAIQTSKEKARIANKSGEEARGYAGMIQKRLRQARTSQSVRQRGREEKRLSNVTGISPERIRGKGQPLSKAELTALKKGERVKPEKSATGTGPGMDDNTSDLSKHKPKFVAKPKYKYVRGPGGRTTFQKVGDTATPQAKKTVSAIKKVRKPGRLGKKKLVPNKGYADTKFRKPK